MIPTRSEPLRLDAAFRRSLLLEEVERELADHAEVLCGVSLAGTHLIFAEGDIKDPVELVLDAPVGPDRAGGLGGGQVGDA